MTQILTGKEVALKIYNNITAQLNELAIEKKPGLAVVLVGENPASIVYVNHKKKKCEELNFNFFLKKFDEMAEENEILSCIDKLNNDKQVNGIIVQLPLPDKFNTDKIIASINPEKDVDGLHFYNQGLLLNDKECLISCTPKGIIKLLDYYNIDIESKKAIIIGRSRLVGKPLSILLLKRNATITIAHSRTNDLKEECKINDLVFVAMGKPKFINRNFLNENSIVIDVGIHRTAAGLCGDVDFEDVNNYVKAITPVPGGVGILTVACLLENTFESFLKSLNS